ncbi:MAG: GntR family transcriptional regulator [Kiloniellales bacterium]
MPLLHSLRRASIPLYVEIADLLRRQIERGLWPPGQRLPTLEELARQYGVARVTVRQAMDVLSREGRILRRQGKGTFVAGAPGDRRWLHLEAGLEALAAFYEGTRPRLLMLAEAAAAPVLEASDGIAAPEYQFMRRVHSLDDVPYALIDIYLDARVFGLAPRRFRTETVISLLLSLPGVEIAKARQTLTIGTADVETAALLAVPVNSPTADVRRVFTAPDGTVIYLGEVTYRGDFIRFEIDLKG